jgi:hypothetical protein
MMIDDDSFVMNDPFFVISRLNPESNSSFTNLHCQVSCLNRIIIVRSLLSNLVPYDHGIPWYDEGIIIVQNLFEGLSFVSQ